MGGCSYAVRHSHFSRGHSQNSHTALGVLLDSSVIIIIMKIKMLVLLVLIYGVEAVPCNEEKERKGKIENPSGRDFSAKKKQGEVVCYLP